MRIVGAIAILTLASACATTTPTAAPAPVIPTIASSTTTTTTTPTVEPVALPVDLVGKTATTVDQQLRTLGFTAFRYLAPDGKQVASDPSWTVVSVDGAGSSLRTDAVIIVRVDKPAPPPPPKVTPKPVPPQPQPPVEPAPEPEPPVAAYYKNCDAARAAGAAPLHRGDPGYRSALDRDSDGVACE